MPNSILWIGLVVLWVFVLFPLLAARYPRIRRTTDTALATRVLHRGGTKSRATSGGHDSDPDWIPRRVQREIVHGDDAEDRMTTSADEHVTEHDHASGTDGAGAVGTDVIEAEFDEFGDVGFDSASAQSDDVRGDDADAEPGSGAVVLSEAPDAASDVEPDPASGRVVPPRRGRGGYDPEADAMARAARYRFRQRTTLGLVLSALLFGGFAVAVTPMLWWGCGAAGVLFVGYLIYLRRQVRLEEEIRRRRSARLTRGGRPAAAEHEAQHPASAMDRDTARDLRRRAVVLDVDDEDPMFDFLETFDVAAVRATRTRSGEDEIRRASGE
ncbi:divisome protein SepX/GlpR [Nocardia alni]|uniref:divisome protein SepX/GlpR n=1 Tax=Nocardia alni TaxID=2815723 RepID=UPI001C23573E|nr:gephyrin-like molybdotransferase receptor GlpR [Nocardia alni]